MAPVSVTSRLTEMDSSGAGKTLMLNKMLSLSPRTVELRLWVMETTGRSSSTMVRVTEDGAWLRCIGLLRLR